MPSLQSLAATFVDIATQAPQRLAVWGGDSSLTYGELLARASQVARALRQKGIQPGDPVGLAVPRSLESVTAVLGVLLAGAAYVPIDPDYPEERQRFILSDSGAQVILVQGGKRPLVTQDTKAEIVALDAQEVTSQSTEPPDVSSDHDEGLLCLVYTSGSTGQPKGVCVPRRGMHNRFRWGWQRYPFAPDDVIAHRSSLNFLDATTELFSGLLRGQPTVIVSPDEAIDLHRLVFALSRRQVTRVTLVPSLLAALLRTFPDLGERLPTVRLWVSSGEELSTALLRRFRVAHPSATLLNLYGSTEVCADVTYAEFAPDTPLPDGRVPIGHALADAELWVLDEQLAPAPADTAGELYVGGPVLCRGYWKRPDEDQRRFVPSPFRPGERLFRTGDRVRADKSGQLDYLGRADNQVKVNGIRIELEEIEQAVSDELAAGSLVAAVAVPSVTDPQSRRLWLFASPQDVSLERLRLRAQRRLPAAMVPSRWMALPALPLTPSGKLNRTELTKLAQRMDAARQADSVPLRPEEEPIGKLYGEVLSLWPIDGQDSLASLGGDSLTLAELAARLAEQGLPSLPLQLLRDSTLSQVTRWLTQQDPLPETAAKPFRLVPAQSVDQELLLHFATEVFVAREPLCQSLRLTKADLLPYYRVLLDRYLPQGLSLLAVDEASGEPIGFSIAGDWTTEIPMLPHEISSRMSGYLRLVAVFFDEYDQSLSAPVRRGELLDLAIAGAKPGHDGVEMLAEMDQRILTEAARRGFQRCSTLCLHRATIRTAELLGFVAAIRHSYASMAEQGTVAFDVPASIHKEAIFFTKELAPQTT
jgi:amino acid adenylation domain-containing protein